MYIYSSTLPFQQISTTKVQLTDHKNIVIIRGGSVTTYFVLLNTLEDNQVVTSCFWAGEPSFLVVTFMIVAILQSLSVIQCNSYT